MSTNAINKTQLDIETATDRGIIHRDYAAHYFRWGFATKFIKRGDSVLDVGCANGMLASVLYVNRLKPSLYVGIDIRESALQKLYDRKVNFKVVALRLDLRKKHILLKNLNGTFDVITCFEMIEHFSKVHIHTVLSNIAEVMNEGTIFLLSTPNFNGSAAKNHIHEYTQKELAGILGEHFHIERQFGTFASEADIYPQLSRYEQAIYDRLKEYYNSSVMSNIFAPLYPNYSRNILWVMRAK